MILHICSIYDSASELFGRPFYVAAIGQATRSFQDEIKREDPQNELHKHPDDYTLFQLGEFNDNTGEFNTFPPKQILRGKDVI
nr:MAG: nonstructural protein [Microvirus sp.]